MTVSRRADLVLVERGYYESRAQAQSAIAAGLVTVNGRPVTKASTPIADDSAIVAEREHPFVSRGGVKLSAALDHFGFQPQGRICLDVGASTGGFTDVLLKHGARHVFAVDVGHDQFHISLRDDPRITLFEGLDARKLEPAIFFEPPSLIVCDVSFISLSQILPHVVSLGAGHCFLIALVKPQFEVGRGALKKGIVKDKEAQWGAVEKSKDMVASLGWTLHGVIESPLKGGDGNIENLMAAEFSGG